MSDETNKPETPDLKDWSKPNAEGIISVPDELDPLINSIAFQVKLSTISKLFGEAEMICRIGYVAQKFFQKYFNQKKQSIDFALWIECNYTMVHSNTNASQWVNKEHEVLVHGSDNYYNTLIKYHGKTTEEIFDIYILEKKQL